VALEPLAYTPCLYNRRYVRMQGYGYGQVGATDPKKREEEEDDIALLLSELKQEWKLGEVGIDKKGCAL
jgi:hypothetical protein